jgi:type IV pilus assembly protein PilE
MNKAVRFRFVAWRSLLAGFTLMELMVTVAIVAILASIAYPSYSAYVAKGRRADVAVQLVAAQQWLERYYSQHYSYAVPEKIFAVQPFATSPHSGEGRTQYILTTSTATADAYVLTATRHVDGAMAQDVCGTFTVNSLGQKNLLGFSTSRFGAGDAGLAAAMAFCWP